jgi:hypothetical protein
MKKLFKGILGIASLAAVGAAVYYATLQWMNRREEEDDLEMDFSEESQDSREYVTLDFEEEEEE